MIGRKMIGAIIGVGVLLTASVIRTVLVVKTLNETKSYESVEVRTPSTNE